MVRCGRYEHSIPHTIHLTEAATFIGIDYHKKYSVWHAIDAAGSDIGEGRIEHHCAHDFTTLVKRWANPRVVFEASMNCLRASGSADWLCIRDAADRGRAVALALRRA